MKQFLVFILFYLSVAVCSSQTTTLALFGDTQNITSEYYRNQGACKIFEVAKSFNPDAIIVAGDIVESGSIPSSWAVLDSILLATGIYERPNTLFYPVFGSHDTQVDQGLEGFSYSDLCVSCDNCGSSLGQEWCSRWRERFDLPGNGTYYSFIKNNVYSIAVSFGDLQFLPCREGTESWTFLINELDKANNNPAIDWILLYWHYPACKVTPWTNYHCYDEDWLLKMCKDYNVDIVLNGHQHIYYRSHPLIFNDGNSSVVNPGQGTVFMQSSRCNRTMQNLPPYPYHAIATSGGNVGNVEGFIGDPIIKLVINGRTAQGYGINVQDQSVFDTFTLESRPKPSSVIKTIRSLAETTALSVNIRPNPFNSQTKLFLTGKYQGEAGQDGFKLEIFSLDGKLVSDLSSVLGNKAAITWNAENQPAGVYLVRVTQENRNLIKRIINIK